MVRSLRAACNPPAGIRRMPSTYLVEETLPLPARQLVQIVVRLRKCNPQAAKSLIHTGCVRVNRRVVCDSRVRLNAGDRVDVTAIAEPTQLQPLENRLNIQVLYQDEALLVVEKPAGLLTVPTPHREKHTLLSLLSRLLAAQTDRPGSPVELFSVHRLDRDVSGVVLVARSLDVAQALRQQFSQHKPERRYQAIVAGRLELAQGTIRNYLATDRDLNRHSVDSEEEGELAVTHYQRTALLRNTTLVSVQLETGRRNQIRVHFAELGHPVIGETRYRRAEAAHRQWPFRRLALHACELGFEHPLDRRRLHYVSPLPWEMKKFLRSERIAER